MNNYYMYSETSKFKDALQMGCVLYLVDPEKGKRGFDRTTILKITRNSNFEIKIRFDWCNYSTTDWQFATLLIPETNKVFFGARFFWGIIDLQSLHIDKQESCAEFWSFTRYGNTIVVITELKAYAISVEGDTIDTVPIDPPFESEISEDIIKFESPVYGKQSLNLK
ncbi:MAG: hypothetical protein H6579_03395 [Chitinophagales bacterium]|nr:hypothetical protein [Chitinophagales bacterium]